MTIIHVCHSLNVFVKNYSTYKAQSNNRYKFLISFENLPGAYHRIDSTMSGVTLIRWYLQIALEIVWIVFSFYLLVSITQRMGIQTLLIWWNFNKISLWNDTAFSLEEENVYTCQKCIDSQQAQRRRNGISVPVFLVEVIKND